MDPGDIAPVIVASLITLVAGAVLIFRGVVGRAIARRIEGTPIGLTTGQMAAERIEDLEARVAQFESIETRMLELEERLDFTERMLAQATGEKAALPGGPAE